jgi:MFS family permease
MSVDKARLIQVSQERLTMPLAIVAFIVMALSYVVNAMDRQVFSVLVPTINQEFGFSLSQGGLLATVFSIGIGLAGIPTGYLMDKLSRKSVIILGIVLYSILTMLTAASTGFVDMLLYRAGSGIGESMQNAALFSAVGAYFYKRRALALGTLNFAYGIGGFFGPLFGAKMLVASGWKTPFIVYGVIGLVVVIFILFISKKFTEQSEVGGGERVIQVVDHIPKKVWNRNILLGMVAAIVSGIAMYGYLGLYPAFLVKHLGYDATTAGLSMSMFGIGAMMGIPAGYLGDKFRQKWVIIISFLCAMFVGYMIFNVVKSPGMQIFFSFLEGACASGFLFVNIYALMQRCVRPEYVGRASGIFITSFFIASGFAGYMFGALVGVIGWGGAGIIQLTIIPVIGIVAAWFIDESAIMKVQSVAKPERSEGVSIH